MTRKGGEVGMTVKEAILTLNANAVIACERAGFSSATVKMIEDALDTIEDALKVQEPRLITDTELEEIRKVPLILKPNVDAIPVEWLKKVRKDASEGDSLDVGIAEVLDMWEKEQEAV